MANGQEENREETKEAEGDLPGATLLEGFRNFPPREPLIFLSGIFLSSQRSERKMPERKIRAESGWVTFEPVHYGSVSTIFSSGRSPLKNPTASGRA
jgi:hypothetical protein